MSIYRDRGPFFLLLGGLLAASAGHSTTVPFSAPLPLTPNADHIGMVLGDLDADGDTDVVVTDATSDSVSWLENVVGDASLWNSTSITTDFAGARAAALGDVDQDGDLDVVAVAETAGVVAWFENSAGDASSFIRHDIGTSFGGGVDVALADLDRDSRLDLVATAAGDDQVMIWLNPGDDSPWTPVEALGTFDARFVDIADFDADGDLDLLSTSLDTSEVSFAVNDSITFTEESVASGQTGVHDALAADIDGDGDLDVVHASAAAGNLTWVENTGGGWLAHPVATGQPGLVAVTAVDLDSDGDQDLLASLADGAVSWWQNGGAGDLWTLHTLPGPDLQLAEGSTDGNIAATDLDGDGDRDIVATVGGAILWWPNTTYHRNAAFGQELSVVTGLEGAMGLRPADLDGDGDIDLAGTAWFANRIAWWENAQGDGSQWIEHGIDDGRIMAREVFPIDLDQDGDTDLLSAIFAENTVSWWENTAGDASAWTEHLVDTDFESARSLFPVDMDLDGDPDILGAALDGDLLVWWENVGGPTWPRHLIDSVDGVGWVYAADFDRDGDMDVTAALAGDSNRVSWWRNTAGDGSVWSDEQVLGTDLQEANYVHAGDLDGDGYIDVLSGTMRGHRIVWWQNPGPSGSWTEHSVDDDYVGPYSMVNADLDADGDQDVAVASLFGNRVSWFENTTGDALNFTEHTVGLGFEIGRTIRVADLDGDGDLDLAGTASAGDRISWWRQQGGQFTLPTSDAVASPTPDEGSHHVVLLRLEARHLGRAQDDDIVLKSFLLRFETSKGAPLTKVQLDGAVTAIRAFKDNGDGIFSTDVDAEVLATESPFAPSGGEMTLSFPDDTQTGRLAHGIDALFFLTIDLAPTASLAVPGGFRAVHVAALAKAERSEDGIELSIEPQEEVASTPVSPQSAAVLIPSRAILDFGRRGIGEGPGPLHTVTIENQGTASFTVGSVSLRGLDAASFAVVEDTGEPILGPGMHRSLSLTFDPSAIGVQDAQLLFFALGSSEEAATVHVTGFGTDAFFSDSFESGDLSAW